MDIWACFYRWRRCQPLMLNIYQSFNRCKKGKVFTGLVTLSCRSLKHSFNSIKQLLRVLLLPPGWDASPSQGSPPPHPPLTSIMLLVPINTPGWRETMWSKVSCLRKQHDSRDQAQTTDSSGWKSDGLTTRPPASTFNRCNPLRNHCIPPKM